MMTEQCYVPPNLNSGSPVFGPFSPKEMIIFTAFALGGMLLAQSGRAGSDAFALTLISTGASFILIRRFLPSAAGFLLHYRRDIPRIHDARASAAAMKHRSRVSGAVLSFRLGEINFASANSRQREAFLSSFIGLCCTANSASKFISLAVPHSAHSILSGGEWHTGNAEPGFGEYRVREHYAVLSDECQISALMSLSAECSAFGRESHTCTASRSGGKVMKGRSD
jgi:hypothetical protein